MTSNTDGNRDKPSLLDCDSGCWRLVAFPFRQYITHRMAVLFCLIAVGGFSIGLAGCNRSNDPNLNPRSLVAPLATQFPYEFKGTLGRNWGGDEYEIYHGRVIHWVKLVGVNGPEPEQPLYRKVRSVLWKAWLGRKARIVVLGTDDAKCEIARIVVDDGTDLSLDLLERGFGWYDGSDCEYAEAYQDAEKQARQDRTGIWSDEAPVEPREFRRRLLEKELDQLRRQIEE